MFISEIDTGNVRRWIEEDAEWVADNYDQYGSGFEYQVSGAVDAVEDRRFASVYNVLTVIAGYDPFNAAIAGIEDYEDSPVGRYLQEVFERAMEIIDEQEGQA